VHPLVPVRVNPVGGVRLDLSFEEREPRVAEVDENVMSFVEKTLDEDPKIQLEDLFEKAKETNTSIRDLSKRQFNARYPLQVKRRRSQALRSKGVARKKAEARASTRVGPTAPGRPVASREALRQVFLQFATDITGAEERKDLVKVLANVDNYVDQALRGVARV